MTNAEDGGSSEARRLRFGLQGTAPGGFGYKVIADYADDVIFTDAFVSFKEGDLTLTLGQHNTFQGLEELSSSNDTSFTERAAYTDAFGFERRVGLSATYKLHDFLLEGECSLITSTISGAEIIHLVSMAVLATQRLLTTRLSISVAQFISVI
ncbi:porin [Paraglaciecola sp. Hal342]